MRTRTARFHIPSFQNSKKRRLRADSVDRRSISWRRSAMSRSSGEVICSTSGPTVSVAAKTTTLTVGPEVEQGEDESLLGAEMENDQARAHAAFPRHVAHGHGS